MTAPEDEADRVESDVKDGLCPAAKETMEPGSEDRVEPGSEARVEPRSEARVELGSEARVESRSMARLESACSGSDRKGRSGLPESGGGHEGAGGSSDYGRASVRWVVLFVVGSAFWEPLFHSSWLSGISFAEWGALACCVLAVPAGKSALRRKPLRLVVAYGVVALFATLLWFSARFPLHRWIVSGDLWFRLAGGIPFDQRDLFFPVRALALRGSAAAFFCLFFLVGLRGRRFLDLLSWSLGALAAYVLVQVATGTGRPEYWVKMDPDLIRVGGTLGDPNAVGSLMVLLLPSVLLWCGWEKGLRRAAGFVGAGLMLGALAFTGSRAAVFGLFLVLAGWVSWWLVRRWLAGWKGRRARALIVLAGIVIAASMAWGMPRLASHGGEHSAWRVWFAKTFAPGSSLDERLRGRLGIWWRGLEMAADFPVFGSGPGTAYQRMPLYAAEGDGISEENLHNAYLQELVELGAVGLGLYLCLLGLALRCGFQAGRDRRAVALGVLAFLLADFFGNSSLLPPVRLVFWGLLGWLAAGAAPRAPCGAAESGSVAGVSPSPGKNRFPSAGSPNRRILAWGILVSALALVALCRVGEAWRAANSSFSALGFYRHPEGLRELVGKSPQGLELAAPGWTLGDAWIRMPRLGECLRLTFSAPPARPRGVVARLRVNRMLARRFSFSAGKPRQETLCIDPADGETVELELEAGFVAPPTPEVPRFLGLQVGPIHWIDDETRCGCSGLYPASTGENWLWTRKWADFQVKVPPARAGRFQLRVLVAHPDLQRDPVRLTVEKAGQRLALGWIRSPGWHDIPLPLAAGVHRLRVAVSRTWCPRRAGVGKDPRELGVGIGLLGGSLP